MLTMNLMDWNFLIKYPPKTGKGNALCHMNGDTRNYYVTFLAVSDYKLIRSEEYKPKIIIPIVAREIYSWLYSNYKGL